MDADDAWSVGARARMIRDARGKSLRATLGAHYSCRQDSEVGAALPGLIRDLHTSIAALAHYRTVFSFGRVPQAGELSGVAALCLTPQSWIANWNTEHRRRLAPAHRRSGRN